MSAVLLAGSKPGSSC